MQSNAQPFPCSYNPSQWNQRIYICILASIAVFIATYMALYQLGFIDHVWDPVFGAQTDAVLNSDLSHTMRKWMRVPDALLGAMAYLGDVIFGLAGSTRRWQDRPWMVILFGIDVIPLGIVSIILVCCQGLVVNAWCFLCLITACISITLIFMAYGEVSASVHYLLTVWKKSHDKKLLWRTFLGKPSPIACEAAEIVLAQKNKRK